VVSSSGPISVSVVWTQTPGKEHKWNQGWTQTHLADCNLSIHILGFHKHCAEP
jgi:hypothetical protein